MAGSNNFLQWNPTAANQESDAAYTAESLRSGGAGTGAIFPSNVANKAFFQWSTFVTAFAAMMAAKNYNMVDTNLANLQTALSNILTNFDLIIATDHIKIGGIIIQWKEGTTQSVSGTTQTVTFPIAFPNACLFVLVSTHNTAPSDTDMSFFQLVSHTLTQAVVWMQRNADHAFDAVSPLVLAIGW